MTNEIYLKEIKFINTLSLKELKLYIKSLEEQQRDPYPDDDMAGDIAVSNYLSAARKKLKELSKTT